MLKYFQLQYLKRLQYTAKKMTGLSKVAKEANKGLKFLDTRYTQFTYMQKVISCLCSKFCFFPHCQGGVLETTHSTLCAKG